MQCQGYFDLKMWILESHSACAVNKKSDSFLCLKLMRLSHTLDTEDFALESWLTVVCILHAHDVVKLQLGHYVVLSAFAWVLYLLSAWLTLIATLSVGPISWGTYTSHIPRYNTKSCTVWLFLNLFAQLCAGYIPILKSSQSHRWCTLIVCTEKEGSTVSSSWDFWFLNLYLWKRWFMPSPKTMAIRLCSF